MKVTIERATDQPGRLLKLACDHTMVIRPTDGPAAGPELIKFLLKAKHRSVFEHCKITFRITGVSRSLMAQLTRHRAGVFTCASQHYQNYGNVPAILTGDEYLDEAIKDAYTAYSHVVASGRAPKEVARQVLPNAASVNILWTVDARNLFDFLEQRLCKRNVPEMIEFAEAIHSQAYKWWPVLFSNAGAHCAQHNCCNQGGMQAKVCGGFKLCD